jgi:hypothetical protein
MENLSEQFRKLEAIARSVNTFVLGGGDKYLGPVEPVGIILQTSKNSMPIPKRKDGGLFQYSFVLAEHVPLEFTMGQDVCGDEPYPSGVVLALLNDNCEFLDWNPETKSLAYLQTIPWCPDGSMESACVEASGRFNFEVVFRR